MDTNERYNSRIVEIHARSCTCVNKHGSMVYKLHSPRLHEIRCNCCYTSISDQSLAGVIVRWNRCVSGAWIVMTDQEDQVIKQAFARHYKSPKPTASQAPVLPAPHTPILLWIDTRWIEARYNGHGLWVYDAIYGYSREVKDGHYWMELPSFNPESKG